MNESDTLIQKASKTMTTENMRKRFQVGDQLKRHPKFIIQFGSTYTVVEKTSAGIFVKSNQLSRHVGMSNEQRVNGPYKHSDFVLA